MKYYYASDTSTSTSSDCSTTLDCDSTDTVTMHYDDDIFLSYSAYYEDSNFNWYEERRIDRDFLIKRKLHEKYLEHRFKVLLSTVFNVYAAGYWRRQLLSKSGFVGRAGKRLKN